MRLDELDYDLPPDRIAQRPAEPRDASRLLVLDPVTGAIEDHRARDLPDLLEPGALIVYNDTRVIPARLLGHKAQTGGRVELLLVSELAGETCVVAGSCVPSQRWSAMGKASKPLRLPALVTIDADRLAALVERRREDGLFEVSLWCPDGSSVAAAIASLGHVPLPPYIKRADGARDVAAYQTVFARVEGAVAAPTAGLHFTERLVGALSARGIRMSSITLHVGPGTFQPVTTEDLDDHRMHEERYEVPAFTARAIEAARREKRPVLAVGTTSVRALESCADPARPGLVAARAGSTSLLIQPGFAFGVVDALLTNFHLPRSTLLALVVAFAGREATRRAYSHALEAGYRFYSYGDAMLVRRRASVAAAP